MAYSLRGVAYSLRGRLQLGNSGLGVLWGPPAKGFAGSGGIVRRGAAAMGPGADRGAGGGGAATPLRE